MTRGKAYVREAFPSQSSPPLAGAGGGGAHFERNCAIGLRETEYFARSALAASAVGLSKRKDPLRRKESDWMEPSGLEPLTPCMPCRCSTS